MNIFGKILIRLMELLVGIPFLKIFGDYYKAGQIYERGFLRGVSLKAAAKCYVKAINQSDFGHDAAKAAFRLATMYENGEGVVRNYGTAAELYALVVNKRLGKVASYAMNNLGILYKNGLGVDKDRQESIRLLNLSLDPSISNYRYNPCAIINIKYFDLGSDLRCPKDIKMSFELCIELAENGDKDLQYQIAEIYENGVYATKNSSKYREWLIKAANSGNERALSVISYENHCRLRDEREAKTIQDARDGDAVALYELAVMCLHHRNFHFHLDSYFDFNVVPDSDVDLSNFTRRSAEKGYVKAQFLLGLLYEGGKYVPKDYPVTFERVFGPPPQSIPDGFEPSPDSLFLMRDGPPPNYSKAVEWYTLAAEQGHESAKLRLRYLVGSDIIDEEPTSWLDEEQIFDEAGIFDDGPQWFEGDIPWYDPQWIESENEANIIKRLNQHGIFSIWHMTHRDNIEEILAKGILSHTLAYKDTKPKDISDHEVQKRRELNEIIYGRKLHDYAPTYINIKNPMLYVKRDIQRELCLIEISLEVLNGNNFIFCDGNAASRNTKFYNSVSDLENMPWDVLNATYWHDFPDGKRKRCAEILINPLIEPKYISGIHCLTDETLQIISELNVRCKITKEFFFDDEIPMPKPDRFNDIPF